MTEKHAAEVLADQLTEDHAWAAEELKTYIGSMVGAAKMLRTISKLEEERDALRAEVEALREDAERYRWLRQAEQVTAIRLTHYAFEALDAAIDAARKP